VHCNNPALKQEPATSTTPLANVRPAERLDVQRAFFMGLFRRLAMHSPRGSHPAGVRWIRAAGAGPGAQRGCLRPCALAPTDRRSGATQTRSCQSSPEAQREPPCIGSGKSPSTGGPPASDCASPAPSGFHPNSSSVYPARCIPEPSGSPPARCRSPEPPCDRVPRQKQRQTTEQRQRTPRLLTMSDDIELAP
jgi:hypothetical protein